MSVAVIGAGAFGTALAISIAGKGPVTLWARSADHARAMQADRVNDARLPGIRLPESVSITANFPEAAAADCLLLAVPMQQLRSVLTEHRPQLADKRLVACCKGIELGTGLGPVAVIAQEVEDAVPGILTGPSFAQDIARGLPTALTLACRDPAVGEDLQHQLSTDNLRIYRTTDTTGAELGGALKNVIAIACGAVIGAGLGVSARAALMTRGYAEMQRFALSRDARPETLSGLSGFGDLALTCTSEQSRNFRLGVALGTGSSFDPSITVEGAATARAIIASQSSDDLPVTACVVDLLDGTITMTEAVRQLLARPLKAE